MARKLPTRQCGQHIAHESHEWNFNDRNPLAVAICPGREKDLVLPSTEEWEDD